MNHSSLTVDLMPSTTPTPNTTTFERPRLRLSEHARGAYRAMIALDGAIELDSSLRDLVSLRASILNGCAYCVDMHTLDARHRGESEQRLHAVAAWHEAPLFSEASARRSCSPTQ